MSGTVSHPSSSCEFIPWQLRRDDLLFVLLPAGQKGLEVPGWNRVCNGRRWDNPILSAHLGGGGNYGMYPAPGSNLLFLDIDDAGSFHAAGGADIVGDTYRYSAWDDRHKYRAIMECSDVPGCWYGRKTSIKKIGAHKDDPPVFELFFPANSEKTGGQCVAPGSIHPDTKNRYEPFDPDASILPVSWEDISKLIDIVNPEHLQRQIPKDHKFSRSSGNSLNWCDKFRLSIFDYMPRDARPSGEHIRGTSPFHDSTSGSNAIITPSKGLYFCFRHWKGYDAFGCDAIRRGIIECGDPYSWDETPELMKEHLRQLEQEHPELKLLDRKAWKKRQQQRGKQ